MNLSRRLSKDADQVKKHAEKLSVSMRLSFEGIHCVSIRSSRGKKGQGKSLERQEGGSMWPGETGCSPSSPPPPATGLLLFRQRDDKVSDELGARMLVGVGWG